MKRRSRRYGGYRCAVSTSLMAPPCGPEPWRVWERRNPNNCKITVTQTAWEAVRESLLKSNEGVPLRFPEVYCELPIDGKYPRWEAACSEYTTLHDDATF